LLKTIEKYKPEENCPLCDKQFISPVEVECGHIYCTGCAIKITKCKECGKRLGGIMNNAAGKLAQKAQTYADMVAKLDNQS
jgi:RING finger protein 113A